MSRFWIVTFLLAWWAVAIPQPQPMPLKPSYLPAVGRTFHYRLIVSGEIQAETSGIVGFAHFGATVEIEQKWQKSGNNLRCDLTVKGGTLRVFSSVGEQVHKLGWTQLTLITSPTGEVVDLMGSGARSFDELVANFDLMAAALASLVVPFPKEGVRIGDAWQGVHQLGPSITLTTVHFIEQPTSLPAYLQPLKLRLRYLLPIDSLVDPMMRTQANFSARYTAESEVLFSATEGQTVSASGTIKLEVGMRVPMQLQNQGALPEQKQQDQPENSGERQDGEGQGEQTQRQEQNRQQTGETQKPEISASFHLKVDAKFDLVRCSEFKVGQTISATR